MFEHIGDAINDNEFGEGQMVVLAYGDDENGVCIGEYSLSFHSITAILKVMHAEATRLLEEPHQQGVV